MPRFFLRWPGLASYHTLLAFGCGFCWQPRDSCCLKAESRALWHSFFQSTKGTEKNRPDFRGRGGRGGRKKAQRVGSGSQVSYLQGENNILRNTGVVSSRKKKKMLWNTLHSLSPTVGCVRANRSKHLCKGTGVTGRGRESETNGWCVPRFSSRSDLAPQWTFDHDWRPFLVVPTVVLAGRRKCHWHLVIEALEMLLQVP